MEIIKPYLIQYHISICVQTGIVAEYHIIVLNYYMQLVKIPIF